MDRKHNEENEEYRRGTKGFNMGIRAIVQYYRNHRWLGTESRMGNGVNQIKYINKRKMVIQGM